MEGPRVEDARLRAIGDVYSVIIGKGRSAFSNSPWPPLIRPSGAATPIGPTLRVEVLEASHESHRIGRSFDKAPMLIKALRVV